MKAGVNSRQGPAPQTLPTMRVKVKESDAEAVINRADFDPDLHEKVEVKKARTVLKGDVEEPNLHDPSDVKEPGPVKTKEDKDRLEGAARKNIGEGKDGASGLTKDPRVDVRPEAKR